MPWPLPPVCPRNVETPSEQGEMVERQSSTCNRRLRGLVSSVDAAVQETFYLDGILGLKRPPMDFSV